MSNEQTPIEGSQDTSSPEGGNTEDDSQNVDAVKVDQERDSLLKSLQSELSQLKENQQKQSQYIGKLEKQLVKEPEKKLDKPNPMQEQLDDLKSFKANMEKRESFVKENAKLQEIRQAVSDVAGVTGRKVDVLTNLIAAQTNNIAVELDESTGKYSVSYKENEYDPMPIKSYVESFFNGDGKEYLPTKKNPNTSSEAKGGTPDTGVRTATKADLRAGKIQPEDIITGKVKIVA